MNSGPAETNPAENANSGFIEKPEKPYVSRAGLKLAAALDAFGCDPTGWTCADFGSNVGGFVDCLLRRGASKIYAIDTGYGVLAWALRRDPRVIVMERTNAMFADLPEPVDLVTIDVAWTPQTRILPNAARHLKPSGCIISLIKPHYEADKSHKSHKSDKSPLDHGILPPELAEATLQTVRSQIHDLGLSVEQVIESPIVGSGGNREYLALIRPPS
ncbi:MAG: TlyA family RNA methyltransferase [Phycisphaerae bacterium]|nr:TlyA family RNA methyltransferase [Phycisphaerae bacterium]